MLKDFCLAILGPILCVDVAHAQPIDTLKHETASKAGPYGGYATWKEYLKHQDSIPTTGTSEPIELGWFSWGLGSTSALPYQFSDWAILAQVTYERENLLGRLRYLGARDYNYGNNSESLDEIDALAGYGWHKVILINASIGIGLRHRFHYLDDPYQTVTATHVEGYYFAVPLQGEVVIPLATTFGQTFGVGLEYYATWTSEGIDHGLLVSFHIGKLGDEEKYPAPIVMPGNH